MKYFLFIIITAGLLSFPVNAQAQGVAVVELFTSPLCADTPPANETLANLAKGNDQNLIALSCNVSYFNKENSKDPLSTELCDTRQKNYFIALGLRTIQTPQIIINGYFDTQGMVEKTVRAGTRMVKSMNTARPVSLTLNENTLNLELPQIDIDTTMDVWLFSYKKTRSVEIPAAIATDPDQTFSFSNNVIALEKLMAWDGSFTTMSYPLKAKEATADGYAVIVQHQDQTHIIAAGKVEK